MYTGNSNPLLTVFIDGLKPESLENMPFLNAFKTKKRIKTELGYSITCHTSMYTGVFPNKHLRWFIWMYSPNSSPFQWIKQINQLQLWNIYNNKYMKYAAYRTSKFLNSSNTSYFSIPFLWHMPMNLWPYFDVTEKRFWSQSNFLDNYPTIFEILAHNNVEYEIVGMTRSRMDESSKIVEHHSFDAIKPWTYLFIGDIDPLSHKYGQNSVYVRDRLKKIDDILGRVYNKFEMLYEDFNFMLFSDHGHTDVNGNVNLHSFFRSHGMSLNNIIHFIDANYARFWFKNQNEKKVVVKILSELENKGFILTDDCLKRYEINMPDNRYGELIFYLDKPYIFDHGKFVVAGKQRNSPPVSGHGYLPDYVDSYGIFVSNKNITKSSGICLEDIAPTISSNFNIPKLGHMDGDSLWKMRL